MAIGVKRNVLRYNIYRYVFMLLLSANYFFVHLIIEAAASQKLAE